MIICTSWNRQDQAKVKMKFLRQIICSILFYAKVPKMNGLSYKIKRWLHTDLSIKDLPCPCHRIPVYHRNYHILHFTLNACRMLVTSWVLLSFIHLVWIQHIFKNAPKTSPMIARCWWIQYYQINFRGTYYPLSSLRRFWKTMKISGIYWKPRTQYSTLHERHVSLNLPPSNLCEAFWWGSVNNCLKF